MVRFNLPTLVTLTAPTCAGKSFLLEALVSDFGFERIVSTTDRQPRAGEVEGVHYNFISTEQSKNLEAQGELAELVTYNGVRYGVTHREMESKMLSGHPPIVILEPSGLEIYRKYCASKNWQLFSVYVHTQESERLERLTARTTSDIWHALENLYDQDVNHVSAKVQTIHNKIRANNNRMKAIFDQERNWLGTNTWDVIADGTCLKTALDQIQQGITNRNNRRSVYD